MNYILNIHTSFTTSHVSVSSKGQVLLGIDNSLPEGDAAFLHVAIKKLMNQCTLSLADLQAVAVTSGPGSYTGIRIGLAAAKGLCFGLDIPLIYLNGLRCLALDVISLNEKKAHWYCPMIDARRMEVYTAVYDNNGEEIMPACALIFDENSEKKLSQGHSVLFFGNGSTKFKTIACSEMSSFTHHENLSQATLAHAAYSKFLEGKFADLKSAEALYLKPVHL